MMPIGNLTESRATSASSSLLANLSKPRGESQTRLISAGRQRFDRMAGNARRNIDALQA
jgi:hypothetical protein